MSEDLFYGTSISDCLLPCVRTKVEVEDKVMMVYNESTTTLGQVFQKNITSSYKLFSCKKFLNFPTLLAL